MNIDCKQTPGERHLGGCDRRPPFSPRGGDSALPCGGARGRGHTCGRTGVHKHARTHPCMHAHISTLSRTRVATRLCKAQPSQEEAPYTPALPHVPATGRGGSSLYSWWVIMGLSPGWGAHHKRNTFYLQVSPSWPLILVPIPFLEREWGETESPPPHSFSCIYPRPKSLFSLQNPLAFLV